MLLNRAQVGLTLKLCFSVITYQKAARDSFEMSFPYTYHEYFDSLNVTMALLCWIFPPLPGSDDGG